ncbi:MAG: hypothetical protein K0V04_25250 [Deltaproteobacteria bacterium]|nr:hypothetical protein [Deltaproteobacteria bacterium]
MTLPSAATAADVPTRRIMQDVPWALALDDALSKSIVEQRYGPPAGARWRDLPPRWDGDRLVTRDSFDAQALAELGLPPLHAEAYEPSPAVVYVAMDGITLQPECSNGDSSNSALRCTPLVDQETSFPAFQDGAEAEYQQLQSYFEPFDVVFTTEPPPEYQPYLLAVVGGSSIRDIVDLCGRATLSCDGLLRNLVSVNFPESCENMANTIAHEIGHNFGLEHTDYPVDMLYPYINGGWKTFVSGCLDISHATGSGITACGYIHELHCPEGGGEQQNTYEELMGVVGPRVPDVVAPQVISTFPPDGAQMTTDDAFTITAHIEDDSRTVGVRWTWLKGMPEGLDSFTRCTNHVCDEDFNPGVSFVPGDLAWDFIGFSQPPVGEYEFLVEVIDAYGNLDARLLSFEVVEDDGTDSGESGVDDGAVDDGTGIGTGTGTGGNTDGPGGTATNDTGEEGDTTAGDAGQDGGSTDTAGCGCRSEQSPSTWTLGLGLMMLGLARPRRRTQPFR